jgi:general secretion pathway protein K
MQALHEPDDTGAADVGIEREVQIEEWQPDGTWHEGQYGGGTYAIRMLDEGGRVSLHRADQALLRRIFTNLGFELDAADEIVDAILDWRDRDTLERLHGAEDEYYLGLRQPYRAKNGRFDSVDELLLVRGITPELLNGTVRPGGDESDAPPVPLREVFSVFNETANINVRTAPAAVLRALLGEGEDVEEIVQARDEDPDGALALIRAKAGDATLGRRIVDRKAAVLAIDARATMQLGRVEARIGAVINLGEDGEGFQVLRWYDRRPAA